MADSPHNILLFLPMVFKFRAGNELTAYGGDEEMRPRYRLGFLPGAAE